MKNFLKQSLVIAPLFAASLHAASLTSLRCEYLENPLGIDVAKPRLSWVIEEGKQKPESRGQKQTAYQVLVASSEKLLKTDKGDLWDSGKAASDQSIHIEYAGRPLASRTECHWKARVWDQNGKASEWSTPATWTMGILKLEDWTARWISTEKAVQAGAVETSGKLKILKAIYSARDGAGTADVTAKVSQLMKNGILDIRVASETLGGDPALNHAKDLAVEYELNGVRGSTSAADFEQLTIPGSLPGADAPYAGKTFDLTAIPVSALATVNVMGFYELHVNGKKVGPNIMGPALSNYGKRSLYETYDLVPYLRKGRNCIGLWLSRGWRDKPIARMQLDMMVDGRPLRIATDGKWRFKSSGRTILGPWQWNNMGGEQVDARLDDPLWSDPATSDSEWSAVTEITAPAVPAEAQQCPPMRVLKTIPAVSCIKLANGSYQLDFGTQLTGWLKLRVRGQAAGHNITIEYADKLDPLQTFNQLDRYICAGKPVEEFCSKFNYHGFRWAIIKGLATAPELADAEAELIGADFQTRGGFASSSEQLNRMHQVNLWTILCLSQSGFLSDCPHRERLGYGDGQVSIESCVMNYMMQPFFSKWSTDWVDGANPDTGYMPHTAPQGSGGGGPAWGGAGQALTWRNYLYYQDKRIVERNLDACRRHIEAIEAPAKDGVVRAFGGEWDFIGDWVPPERGMDTHNWPPKPAAEFFNNCYRLYLREQWAQLAGVLGRQEEARAMRAELVRLRPLVHAAFYDKDKKLYVLDEQSYYLMPLMTGVVPEELRPAIMNKLEECIRITRKGHLDTGMLGTYFLMNHLMDIGRNDLLWLIVTQKDYPGWGHMLEKGATTWWEQWNGYYSQIHSCFTSLDGWFYQGLAGIRPDAAKPGFKHIIVKPAVVGDLTWVKCHHDSPYGRIVSNWKREGQKLTMEVTIPPNTMATVYVPTKEAAGVTESGKPASKAKGVKVLRMESGAAVYAVGSGSYQFQSILADAVK